MASEIGNVSQSIQVGQRHVVAQLKEKKAVNSEEFAKARDSLRQSLIGPKKDKMFQTYLDSVKETMTRAGSIKIDEAEFATLTRRM